jgi:hypothetical protein
VEKNLSCIVNMANSCIFDGPGSSVGMATDYGLDSPEIESRCGEIFRLSILALRPRYRVLPGGKVRPRRAADHSPPSSAVVLKE